MSQRRQLREYQLVEMMLTDRELLYAEFEQVAGPNGEEELGAVTDRDKILAILSIEFPAAKQVGPDR